MGIDDVPGRWIVLACQRECRIKTPGTPLTIVDRIVAPAEARTRVADLIQRRPGSCNFQTTSLRVAPAPATWIVTATGRSRVGTLTTRWSVHKATGRISVANGHAMLLMTGCTAG